MLYYLDTCIWRDYYENRTDGLRPIGDWAYQLIQQGILAEQLFLVSTITVRELRKDFSPKQIHQIFLAVLEAKLLRQIQPTANQIREASSVAKAKEIPFGDALHAILARDNHAILITRDRHFRSVTDICSIRLPEELL